jgi:TPR repeat protein
MMKWSADQGHCLAQLDYGECLEQGNGVSLDRVRAAHYFEMAMDGGEGIAKDAYERCRQ